MTLRRSLSFLILIVLILVILQYTCYGASSNHIQKVLTVGQEVQLVGEDAQILIIELKDDLQGGDLFYLNLNGAKYIAKPELRSLSDDLDMKGITSTQL